MSSQILKRRDPHGPVRMMVVSPLHWVAGDQEPAIYPLLGEKTSGKGDGDTLHRRPRLKRAVLKEEGSWLKNQQRRGGGGRRDRKLQEKI